MPLDNLQLKQQPTNTQVTSTGGKDMPTLGGYNPNLVNAIRTIDFNDVYAYAGPSEGFIKKYPYFDPSLNNAAINAERQSTWELTGNTLKKFGTLTLSTFLNQGGSTFSNIGKIATGDLKNFYDTDLSKYAADVATASEYKYPIYSTKEMQQYESTNKGALATVGKYVPFASPNYGRYWGRLFGQLGFTAGTVAYAALEEVALAAVTAEAGGVGALTGLARNTNKIVRSVSQLIKGTDRLMDSYKTVSNIEKVGKFGLQTLRMANLATGEARIEAAMSIEAFRQQEIDNLKKQGKEVTIADLERINIQAEKVGNTVFNWNMPVLLMNNMVTILNIIKPRALTVGKAATAGAKVISDGTKWAANKELIKSGFKSAGIDLWSFSKKLPETTIAEGLEELAQGLGSRAAQQYYSLSNTDVGKSNLGFITELGTEFSRTFQTGEGWDEFVSGFITGGLLGGKKAFSDVRAENREAVGLAEEFNTNKSILLRTTKNLEQSINTQSLNEQGIIANKSAVAQENGDIKSVKDLRNDAMVGFFNIARRSGKDKQAIQEMIDQVNAAKEDNPAATEELLGGKSLEEFQIELNTAYDKYTKYADMVETVFNKDLTAKGKDQGVIDFVKRQYITGLMGLEDTRDRVASIQNDLKDLTNNNTKAFELINNVFNEDGLIDVMGQVSSFIKSTEQFLSEAEITKEERKQKIKELNQNKAHLEALTKVNEVLYGDTKKYSPEVATKRIKEAINRYTPNINNEVLDSLVNDMVNLEADSQRLTFFTNAMYNKNFRDKYYDAAKKVADKVKSEGAVVENEQQPTTVAESMQQEITPNNLDDTTTNQVLEVISEIEQTSEGFVYNGDIFNTKEEAILSIFDETTKAMVEPNLPSLIALGEMEIETTPTQPVVEHVTNEEYQEYLDNNKTVSAEVAEKLKNIVNKTPREQEMLDSLVNQTQQETKAEIEVKEQLPKTKADVIKYDKPGFIDSVVGIVTNYYNVAVGRVYSDRGKILRALQNKKLTAAVNGLKDKQDIRITTINLNDNLINENVINENEVTSKLINDNITTSGYAVVKDKKGRLIILTRGTQAQARAIITRLKSEGGIGLYLNPTAEDRFVEVRMDSADGAVASSSFAQETFTNKSSQEINKVRKGDTIQVVIPKNQYNEDLVNEFNSSTPQDTTEQEGVLEEQRQEELSNVSIPKLPSSLKGAKPRYGFGDKQYQLAFESDIDKAAYIIAQDNKSKKDKDYLDFVMAHTGLSETNARKYGKKVKETIKILAKDGDGGTLNITPQSEYDTNQQAIATINEKYDKEIQKLRETSPIQKSFKKLQENLIIELRSNGATIGIMRAGDYFLADTELANKVDGFRAKAIPSDVLTQVMLGDFTVGTVGVSKVVATHRVNINDSGMVFTTLDEYEKSFKDNKDVKIEYFIGETPETAVRGKKTISRSGIGREGFFLKGAVYATIRNTKTGEEVTVQAVSEQPTVYTQEDLKRKAFKQQLSVNLRPSESPLISKRVAIDETTFTKETFQTTRKSKLKSEIQKAQEGTDTITINTKNLITPLTEVSVDYDTQLVTGKDPNGKEQVFGFNSITSVSPYVASQVSETVSDTEFSDFVDNGNATQQRLESIAQKVKNNEELSKREFAIFADKTSEINSILKQITKEELPQNTAPIQTQEWVLENGTAGETYVLEDGTELKIISFTSEGVTIDKEGFKIRLDNEGNEQEKVNISEVENENISEESLLEIWKSQNKGLSLREELLLEVNADRVANFVKERQDFAGQFFKNYEEYYHQGVKDMLSALGFTPEVLLLNLAITNFEGGNKAETLQELLVEAGYSEQEISSIQDTLNFGAYISLFNLVKSPMQANVSHSKVQQGKQLVLDFGEELVTDAIDAETTSEDSNDYNKNVNKFANRFKKLINAQGLVIKGIDTLKNMTGVDLREVTKAVKNFVFVNMANVPAADFIRSYVTLNKALKPYGMEVNLSRLVKVVPKSKLGLGVEFVQINDTKEFLQEFDDKVMNSMNQDRLEDGAESILVKKDDGGWFELPIAEISSTPNTTEQNDKVYLDDILEPLGWTVDEINIIANHTVNGSASSLLERSIRRVKAEQEINYDMVENKPLNGTTKEDYINRNKEEQKVKTKTCK